MHHWGPGHLQGQQCGVLPGVHPLRPQADASCPTPTTRWTRDPGPRPGPSALGRPPKDPGRPHLHWRDGSQYVQHRSGALKAPPEEGPHICHVQALCFCTWRGHGNPLQDEATEQTQGPPRPRHRRGGQDQPPAPWSSLNSRSEFRQPKVARVALVRSLPATQVQLGGDTAPDNATSAPRVQRDRQGTQTIETAAAPMAPQGPTQPTMTANHGPNHHTPPPLWRSKRTRVPVEQSET